MRDPELPRKPPVERLLPSVQTTMTALLPLLLPLGVLLLQYLVWDLIAPYAWVTFLPAVAVCGWFSGLRGGLLSVLMSVAGAEWLLTFDDDPHILDIEARIFAALLFSALAAAVVLVLDQVHRERARLHAAIVALRAAALEGLAEDPELPPWRPWQRHFASDLSAISAVRRELDVRRQCANAIELPFATFAADGRCLFANTAFLAAVQLSPGEWQGRNALEPSHFPGSGLASALRRLLVEAPPRTPGSVQVGSAGECQLMWVGPGEGGVALCAPLTYTRAQLTLPPRAPPVLSSRPAERALQAAAAPAASATAAPTGARATSALERAWSASTASTVSPPASTASTAGMATSAALVGLADTAPPAVAALRPGGAPRPVAGLRCLVVDDQELNRELLREILAMEGALPVCVASGREAVAAVTRRPEDFDVVLMDLQMPGMDGYASARAIRTVADSDTLPILAITADGPGVPMARLQEAGMQGLLHKPLDVELMLAMLARQGGGVRLAPGARG